MANPADQFLKLVKKYTDPRNLVKRKKEEAKVAAEMSVLANMPIGGAKTGNLPKVKKAGKPDLEEDDKGGLRVRARSHIGAIIGSIFLIAILIGAYLFFTGNSLIKSYVGNAVSQLSPAFNQKINGVPLSDTGAYMGCFFGYLINPGGLVQGSSGSDVFGFIDASCKQQFNTAQEVGCTECFTLDAQPLNTLVTTAQDAVIVANVKATDTQYCYDYLGQHACKEVTPAANPQVWFEDQNGDKTGFTIDQNFDFAELGNQLDPQIISSTPFTFVGTEPGTNFCGPTAPPTLNAKAVLSYVYRTEGNAPINIRKSIPANGESFAIGSDRSPVTLPGPVKIDMIPDSSLSGNGYTAGLAKKAYLSIRFRNAGEGQAAINKVTLIQIPPEGSAPLKVLSCSGPVTGTPTANSDGSIDIQPDLGQFVINPSQRTASIICSFDLTGIQPVNDITTYTITGSATYEYVLKRDVSSIIVSQDKEACAAATVSSTGGPVAACQVPANENKECPAGSTFQQDGCCR